MPEPEDETHNGGTTEADVDESQKAVDHPQEDHGSDSGNDNDVMSDDDLPSGG